MDELLRDFLTETGESLERVDSELVRFEQEPNNTQILGNIFRLVHTIKGTCGFLALPRLAALTHAAETLMGNVRDGLPVTAESVTLILSTIDRIKFILNEIEANEREPAGSDDDLINELGVPTRQQAAPRPEHSERAKTSEKHEPVKEAAERSDDERGERISDHSIRVNVKTLDNLMTTVSELVLTRNQLLEM